MLVAIGGLAGGLISAGWGSRTAGSGAGEIDAAGIFRRDCAECHGADGGGTSHAPPLIGAGAALVDYVLSTGRMPIDEPDDPIRRGDPSYDEETVLAVAAYVDGLWPGGEPIPTDIADGDVARGGELYRLNCAACHHATGSGGALVARAAPPVVGVARRQVAEAIRTGPFGMPAFGPAALSDRDVADVTAYVADVLDDRPDRGGWSIWHLGPVPEGAIAIVGGLGSLLLVGVWIEGRMHQ